MRSRLASFAACFLALLASTLAAQTASGALSPDRGEIESANASAAKIVFVNYEGPQSRIDSLAEIEGIGSSLGREIAAASSERAGAEARYMVIRAIDPSVKDGLDADILVLGADAQVDHIRNLRWIIAGYLVSAWAYSEKDAYTLATFITIYDAVHRGDMAYFSSKYKAVVLKELGADNAGLALSYKEWPGRSRIVIPLSSGAAPGRLGTVDTGAVSDQAVVQSLKAQSDKGVSDRQALVDVKEREAAQAQADLDKQKADLAKAQEKLAADQAKAEADRAALEAAKAAQPKPAQPAQPAQQPAQPAQPAQQPAQPAAQQPSQPAAATSPNAAPAAELATKEAAVKAEESKVQAEQASVTAKQQEVASGEAAVAAKQQEAASDRKDITNDQKTVIASEVAAKQGAAANGVYLIRVGDDADHLGQIVFMDPDKGQAIRSSRINTIHLRSFAELSDAFVAVSGLQGKPGGVKLIRFDKTSLEDVAEAKQDMFPDSADLVSGATVYAVEAGTDGKFYLAAFGAADLAEKARSKDAVAPYTLIVQASGDIAAQSSSGAFLLLKSDTLEKIRDLNP
jgi:hypothetical protein